MAQLPNGKLVVVTSRREPGYHKDINKQFFTMYAYESADLGLTWQAIGDHPVLRKDGTIPLRAMEFCLATLPDGSLVMIAHKADWTPGTKADAVDNLHVARSSDGGRTWEFGTLPGLPSGDHPRNIMVEPDGSLLTIRPSYLLRKPTSNLQICRSKDGGETWQFSVGIVPREYTYFGEVSTVRLPDGRLLAALRCQIPGTAGQDFADTLLTESSDNGQHWSKPRRMTNTAEVHVYLTKLRDGRILATYANYHLPWGIYAIVSEDGGKTWDSDHPVQLALSADFYTGWPVTLQLADGSLITSYTIRAYLKRPTGQQNVTEVVRWRLPERK